MTLAITPRLTRHGYVAVAPLRIRPCHPPVADGRLQVTSAWATQCFVAAYRRARAVWGSHAPAIATEIVTELVPTMRIGAPQTGAERELRRRVDASVAALLNASGIPTSYPPKARTPRPRDMPPGPPWYRVLLTGWLQ